MVVTMTAEDTYRDRLRQARAVYEKRVAEAAAERDDLFRAAARDGLTYYKIAQFTQLDGEDAGYGQAYIGRICKEAS